MQRTTGTGSCAALALLACGAVLAQQAETPENESPVPNEGEPIDEITVVAPRSEVSIRQEIRVADEVLYGLYNELNTDSRYDIHCRREKRPASNISERVCRPAFERDVSLEAWDDAANSPDFSLPEGELKRHRQKLNEIMLELAAANPDLAEAILRRARLQHELRDLERRRAQPEE